MFLDSGELFLDSNSGKCFWILGHVLDSGKYLWILGRVFGFWDVFLDSGTCSGFWEVFCPYKPPYLEIIRHLINMNKKIFLILS